MQGRGSGTFSVEAEATALKCNRFRFHSDQGFSTEGKFLIREEFHKLGVVLSAAEVKVLVNASSSPDYSLRD